MSYGKLYLIPNFLSPDQTGNFIPDFNKTLVKHIKHFVVENSKPARALIKHLMLEHKQDELKLWQLNEHTTDSELPKIIEEALLNNDCGLISDAGLPCIADPGWQLVWLAHKKNIQVIPLPGASSIFMALMASGLNGQNFAFNGYIPIDKNLRSKKIKDMEYQILKNNQTQIFMETPYRNHQLFADLLSTCQPNLKLCIAANISSSNEYIKTTTINEWKKAEVNIHKIPTIFILGV
ncbi:MAG: SAM-dependent methyltransferase [Bacteroidia bacterium]